MLVVVAVLLVLTSGQLTTAAPAAESQPTRAHIMVATPCYTGTVHEGYFLSVVGALQRIEKSPTAPRLSVSTVAHIADLPKARGALISQFLNSKHYTHVAFVDADIAFDASLPERLVSSGFDVVAAMYAKKAIDVEKLRKGVSVSASLEYPVEFLFEKKPDGKQASRNEQGTARTDKRGFIEVRRAGAGFLMVSRSAIERLVKAHPELHYRYVDGVQVMSAALSLPSSHVSPHHTKKRHSLAATRRAATCTTRSFITCFASTRRQMASRTARGYRKTTRSATVGAPSAARSGSTSSATSTTQAGSCIPAASGWTASAPRQRSRRLENCKLLSY